MTILDRSGQLIEAALTLLDQADDIELRARDGDEIIISNQKLRGDQLAPVIEQAREGAILSMLASVAINAERIANALEEMYLPSAADSRPLAAYSTAEISAELAERLNRDEHEGRPA